MNCQKINEVFFRNTSIEQNIIQICQISVSPGTIYARPGTFSIIGKLYFSGIFGQLMRQAVFYSFILL